MHYDTIELIILVSLCQPIPIPVPDYTTAADLCVFRVRTKKYSSADDLVAKTEAKACISII